MRPGELVRILPQHTDHTGRYALGTVASGSVGGGRLLKIPSDAAPAVFLADVLDAGAMPFAFGHMAQVLLGGLIVNVPACHVERAK